MLLLAATVPDAAAWDFVYGEPSSPSMVNISRYDGVAVGGDGSTYLAGGFSGSFNGLSIGSTSASGFLQKVRPDGTTAWAAELGSAQFDGQGGIGPAIRRVLVDAGGNIIVLQNWSAAWTVAPNGVIEGSATLANAGTEWAYQSEPQAHPAGGILVTGRSGSCRAPGIPNTLFRYAADLTLMWSYDFSEAVNCESAEYERNRVRIVPVSDGSVWIVKYLPLPLPWDTSNGATAMVHVDADGSKIASVLHYDFVPTDLMWASDTTIWIDINWPALNPPQGRVALSAADGSVVSSTAMTYPPPSGLFPGWGQVCNYFEVMSYRAMLSGDRILAEGRCYYQTSTTVTLLGRVLIAYAVSDASGALTPLWWRYPPAGATVSDFEVNSYGDVVIAGSTTASGSFLQTGSAIAAMQSQVAATPIAAAAQNPSGSLWRGRRSAGSVLELKVTGRGGVPDSAAAAVLNVTVTSPTSNGHITVFPCGTTRPRASNLNYQAGATVAAAVISQVGRGGRMCVYTSQAAHVVVDVSGYFPDSSPFESMVPARLLDTRQPGGLTIDGAFAATGRVPAGGVVELAVTARGGVAPNASSVVLNVTATNAISRGFVTVYPCGTTRPGASNLNFAVGRNVANLVVAEVGVDGKVCLYAKSAVDLIADVSGYFPPSGDYSPLTPARLLETRSTTSPTVDGQFWKVGRLAAGSTLRLAVAGRGGIPSTALAAVLNVTATGSLERGFITVYPCGTTRPTASSLNYSGGTTVANAVIAKIGTLGEICVYTKSATDLVIDASGYFPTGTSYVPLVPFRAVDTR